MKKDSAGKAKARRYARSAPRNTMPRPVEFDSKKKYNRKRQKTIGYFD